MTLEEIAETIYQCAENSNPKNVSAEIDSICRYLTIKAKEKLKKVELRYEKR